MLPKSTNHLYHGHRAAAWILLVLSLFIFVPGGIHVFLPDGGAGVIAGIDLTRGGDRIIGVFAWAGATQMAWGAMLFAVAARYRNLLGFALSLLLAERALMALNMWVLKDLGGDKPPGAYGVLIFLPIVALALAASRRRA